MCSEFMYLAGSCRGGRFWNRQVKGAVNAGGRVTSVVASKVVATLFCKVDGRSGIYI